MLRYAVYARKSKEDRSGAIKSIEDQKAICRELATSQNLHVCAEYEENKSAKVPGARPIYAAMIKAIEAGRINAILVWHVDRLARNMAEAGVLAQMLIDGQIEEIRTPFSLFRRGDNILPLLVEQGSATQYSINLSHNVSRGMASMVEAGGWPHQAKVGYLNARHPLNPKQGIIVKDPERFDIVRGAFDLLLKTQWPVRRVVDVMNKEWGFSTRGTPTRPSGPLSYAAAYDIFTNPFYAGFTIHGGVLRRGNHPPMITAAELNRARSIIRRQRQTRRRQWEFTYTGLLTCGRCGLRVTAEQHKGRNRSYVYYHCSDPYLRCCKKGLSEDLLEELFLNELSHITIDPQLAEIAYENILRWLGQQGATVEGVVAEQRRELASIDTQRTNLLNLMLKGVLTDEETFRTKDAELLARRNALELSIAETEADAGVLRQRLEEAVHYSKHARDQFAAAEPDRKKEIVRSLATSLVLRDKEVELAIEPLLGELVHYSQQIRATLETQDGSRVAENSPHLPALRCIGRGTETVIEPPLSLLEALQHSMFQYPRVDAAGTAHGTSL